MKHILIIILLFGTAKAQTWTVARARDSILAILKREAITRDKLAVKDANDDKRNMSIDSLRQSRDLLVVENKRLREKTDSLQKKLDSAGVYALAIEDFIIDSNRTAWVRPKYGPNANTFTIARTDNANTLMKIKKVKKIKKHRKNK